MLYYQNIKQKKRLHSKLKHFISYIFILSLIISIGSGCGENNNNTDILSLEVPESTVLETLLSRTGDEDIFSAADKEIGYNDTSAININLSGEHIFCQSDSVESEGSSATIQQGGTYILSGSLENGRIIINAGDDEDVRIVLNGANITNDSAPAIQVDSANKVYITLAEDSENVLTNNFSFSQGDGANGVIYSKSDLAINGHGSLEITAYSGNGIVSEKNAIITGGTISVSSSNYGISAYESVRISSAMMTVNTGSDGIHSEDADNNDLGLIYISDGIYEIHSNGNGINAQSVLFIDGGAFNITTDSLSYLSSEGGLFGMTAGEEISICSGEFVINSYDNAINSQADVFIGGGSFTIDSGFDGIHGNSDVVLGEARITVTRSFGGITGHTVYILDTSLNITSEDDGICLAGGNDGSGIFNDYYYDETDGGIKILSGNVYICSSGDGIDSNGSIMISGGSVLISSEETAADFNNSIYVTGGTMLGLGNESLDKDVSSSEQKIITIDADGESSGGVIEILDSSDNIIISYTAEKSFNHVILSSSQLTENSTYTLKIDNYTSTFTF